MQLKRNSKMKTALAAATCGLLGVPAMAAAATFGSSLLDLESWKFDAALLSYNEKDRISVVEPVVKGTKDYGDERFLNLKITLDTITGASPNGATSASSVQTFTTPSGNSNYTVQAGEIPLNPSFRDQRTAFDIGWDQPLGRLNRISSGAHISLERDYKSIGINGAIMRDFNNRNTTLSLGLSLQRDSIEPQGGAPEGLGAVTLGTTTAGDDEEESKTVVDLLLGVTQVVSRFTIMQLNFSYGASSGYHTDPYKIVSVINGTTGDTTGYIYEKRPSSRVKNSIYWEAKHHLTKDVVTASARYYWDDWGIRSNTLDFRYRYELGGERYIEPHLRYYQQGKADMYRHSVVSGSVPAEVSADYRLAESTGQTIGFKYGHALNGKRLKSWSLVAEMYTLTGNGSPGDAIGSQKSQDLYPDLQAFIIQVAAAF